MTTIIDPARPEIQAAFLRAHLRLQAVGLGHTQLSRRTILDKAGDITGAVYPNSIKGCHRAIAQLTAFIEESHNATE